MVLVGVAALGLAAGAFVVARSGTDTSSPEDAVLAYRRAAERGDCDAIVGSWTDSFATTTIGMSRETARAWCEDSLEVEDVTIHGTEVVSEGDGEAVVEVTWTGDESGDMVSQFDLVLVEGRWRIDGLDETPA